MSKANRPRVPIVVYCLACIKCPRPLGGWVHIYKLSAIGLTECNMILSSLLCSFPVYYNYLGVACVYCHGNRTEMGIHYCTYTFYCSFRVACYFILLTRKSAILYMYSCYSFSDSLCTIILADRKVQVLLFLTG